MKKIIKLTENDLHKIIENSVRNIISESNFLKRKENKYGDEYLDKYMSIYKKAQELKKVMSDVLGEVGTHWPIYSIELHDEIDKCYNAVDNLVNEFNTKWRNQYLNAKSAKMDDENPTNSPTNNMTFNPFKKKFEVMNIRDVIDTYNNYFNEKSIDEIINDLNLVYDTEYVENKLSSVNKPKDKLYVLGKLYDKANDIRMKRSGYRDMYSEMY